MSGLLVSEGTIGDTATLVSVRGDLDIKTAPDLCARLLRHRGQQLVVDLSKLAFCDSCGLRALVGEARETRICGGSLSVVAPEGGPVRRLLDLTGLTAVLPTYTHRTEAVTT